MALAEEVELVHQVFRFRRARWLAHPALFHAGGDFQIAGQADGRAVDDGFAPDVLECGGMRKIETRAPALGVEPIPDDFLIVVGEDPSVARAKKMVRKRSVVTHIESVKVEVFSLLHVWGIRVDQYIVAQRFHRGQKIQAITFGDVDTAAKVTDCFDPFDQRGLVEARIDAPLSGLVEAADRPRIEDA